jgi:hypothetical protein
MKLTEAPRATASVRRVVRAAMVVRVLVRGAIMGCRCTFGSVVSAFSIRATLYSRQR